MPGCGWSCHLVWDKLGKQMISSESEESPGNSMEEGLALLIDQGK